MLIRPADLDDVFEIAELHVRAWQVGYRGLLPPGVLDGLAPAQRVPRWTAAVEQTAWPGRGVLVAGNADRLVGFAHVTPTRDADQDAAVGEINSFYVDPDSWGQGIGRRLMTAAVDTLAAAGYSFATLWVLATNAPAIAFYRAVGWVPDGAVKEDVVGGATIQDLRYRRSVAG